MYIHAKALLKLCAAFATGFVVPPIAALIFLQLISVIFPYVPWAGSDSLKAIALWYGLRVVPGLFIAASLLSFLRFSPVAVASAATLGYICCMNLDLVGYLSSREVALSWRLVEGIAVFVALWGSVHFFRWLGRLTLVRADAKEA